MAVVQLRWGSRVVFLGMRPNLLFKDIKKDQLKDLQSFNLNDKFPRRIIDSSFYKDDINFIKGQHCCKKDKKTTSTP